MVWCWPSNDSDCYNIITATQHRLSQMIANFIILDHCVPAWSTLEATMVILWYTLPPLSIIDHYTTTDYAFLNAFKGVQHFASQFTAAIILRHHQIFVSTWDQVWICWWSAEWEIWTTCCSSMETITRWSVVTARETILALSWSLRHYGHQKAARKKYFELNSSVCFQVRLAVIVSLPSTLCHLTL